MNIVIRVNTASLIFSLTGLTENKAAKPRRLILQVGANKLHHNPESENGFTLIEILCVLVMIGLLSGVVVMNMPPSKSDLERQAETLTRNLNALSQDGMISGEIRAFGLSQTDFAFYNYNGEAFIPLKNIPWNDDARLSFSRNGQTVKLPETLSPLVIFEPTRVSTEFSLNLSNRDTSFVLSSVGDGRVMLERQE